MPTSNISGPQDEAHSEGPSKLPKKRLRPFQKEEPTDSRSTNLPICQCTGLAAAGILKNGEIVTIVVSAGVLPHNR
jgi:hypothetical protein